MFFWVVLSILGCGSSSDSANMNYIPKEPVEKIEPITKAKITVGTKESALAKSGVPKPAMDQGECGAPEKDEPLLDGCITAEIKCGETIKGHTRGGANRYDSQFYVRNFCTPNTTNHSGGDERIYKLQLTENQMKADVYLDTPCANLDLAAIRANEDTCPSGDARGISRCEMRVKKGRTRETVEIMEHKPATWWIVVEGQDDEEGAFSLTVQCEQWGPH